MLFRLGKKIGGRCIPLLVIRDWFWQHYEWSFEWQTFRL